MKRILLTAAAALVLTGAVFAQKSNTKKATAGLISDQIVDNIQTGTEDDTILFFTGYNHDDQQAEIGLGYQFGPLWLSIYDGYYFKASESTTDKVHTDSVALDGVNKDYTDETETATWTLDDTFKNKLRVSGFFNHQIGASFYWDADNKKYTFGSLNPTASLVSETSGTTTTLSSDEDHAAGTTSKTEWDTLEYYNNKNAFGLDFNGVETPKIGGVEFYVALDTIEVALNETARKAAYTKRYTKNGSTVGATANENYDGEYNDLAITPLLEFELGLKLGRLFDMVDTSFVLIEDFAPTFYSYTNTYDTKKVTDTTATKTTETTSFEATADDRFDWSNTLTPRFNFVWDAGERFTVKTRINLPVTLTSEHAGAYEYEKTTKTAIYDKATGETKYTTTKVTGAGDTGSTATGNSLYDYDSFTTEVDPEFDLGVVYQLYPGKFNVNLGAKLKPGKLTWIKTEKTVSGTGTKTTQTSTDAHGNTTVTSVSYKGANGDTAASGDNMTDDEVTNEFTSGAVSGEAYIGGTWFLNDNLQLDMLLGAATATNSNLTWKFNVAFGFHY